MINNNFFGGFELKYKKGQKVFVDGIEYIINCPVAYGGIDEVFGSTKISSIRYRLENYPQDVDEDRISVTPEELINSL